MDKAHLENDKRLEEMERYLAGIYERESKEIGESWKENLSKIGEEIDDLQKSYEAAKKGGDKEEIKKAGRKLQQAKREKTLLDERYKALTEETARQLLNVNQTAIAYINDQLPEVYAVSYNALEESVKDIRGYSFVLVDAATVKSLALEDKSLLPFKKLDPKKDVPWNMKKINAEVLQGILQGEAMDKIADRIEKVQSMNQTSAIRTARTAVTGAENKGRQDSYERAVEDGVLMEKKWLATKDNRVRHWHAELDRQTADIEGFFSNAVGLIKFPGDPGAHPANVYNCRCSMRAKIKGFKRVRK